jgi:hypothetical protein
MASTQQPAGRPCAKAGLQVAAAIATRPYCGLTPDPIPLAPVPAHACQETRMLASRTLLATALVALLTACTATTAPRPQTPEHTEAAEEAPATPTPAPESSADEPAAEGTPALAQPLYSRAEFERLSMCTVLADTAMHTAIRRNGGMSEEDALNIYRTQPNPEAHMGIVAQVYRDDVRNTWDYTVRHFQRCALTEAGITAARVKTASYCMQQRMIGDLSASFKLSGRPIGDAYGYFANFRSPVVRQIIDAVYATDAGKDEAKAQLWGNCMAPITAR